MFAEALELLDELGGVDAEEVCERLRLERLVEHGGGAEDAVAHGAFGPALGEQRLGERPRGPADWPFATVSVTKRGLPPVESCSSGIPSGASSLGESGSSWTITSGVRWRSG